MLTDLLPEDDQSDIRCEGFGNFDLLKVKPPKVLTNEKVTGRPIKCLSGNINLARRVMFKPMLNLFIQEKLLPLRYCPSKLSLNLQVIKLMLFLWKPQKVFLIVLIGILVISNVSVIH